MSMHNEQKIFRQILSLVGHHVELATHSGTKPFRGVISNAMFDSFLLQTPGGNVVVRFDDIVYLERVAR